MLIRHMQMQIKMGILHDWIAHALPRINTRTHTHKHVGGVTYHKVKQKFGQEFKKIFPQSHGTYIHTHIYTYTHTFVSTRLCTYAAMSVCV